jgi:hypothetical protein
MISAAGGASVEAVAFGQQVVGKLIWQPTLSNGTFAPSDLRYYPGSAHDRSSLDLDVPANVCSRGRDDAHRACSGHDPHPT